MRLHLALLVMDGPGWGDPECVASEETEAGGQPVITATPPHLASCVLGLLHLIGGQKVIIVTPLHPHLASWVYCILAAGW